MTVLLCSVTRKARKHHRCDYCGRSIAPGTTYDVASLKGDYVYRWKAHLDCQAMAFEDDRLSNYGYSYDGIPPLYENEGVMEELRYWRGRFPHVVCRLELNIQMSDIRWRDRLIAKGIDPETHE